MGYFKNRKEKQIAEKLALAKVKIVEAKQKNSEAEWTGYESESRRYIKTKNEYHVWYSWDIWSLGETLQLDSTDEQIIKIIKEHGPGKIYFSVHSRETYECMLTGIFCSCVYSDTVKCNICNISFDRRNENHIKVIP